VVDLDRDPSACIRFDRNAVYVGRPPAEPQCPPNLRGRVDALLIEPAEDGGLPSASGWVPDPVEGETSFTLAGVRVTASFGADPQPLLRRLRAAQPSGPAPGRATPSTR
jgi:hypothetical protein